MLKFKQLLFLLTTTFLLFTGTTGFAQTISSTLYNRTGVTATQQEEFSVTVDDGPDANRLVKMFLVLDNPAQASDITASYLDPITNLWMPLSFNGGVVQFGPATGFPLQDATTNFRVTFAQAGVYAYNFEIIDALTNDTVVSEDEQVTVNPYVSPTVSSTLNNLTGVVATKNVNFTVTTAAGSEENRLVQVHLTLDDTTQATDFMAEYKDQNGNWQPVMFNNGVFEYGPATGFPLMNVNSDFRVTFNEAGTYNYSLSIIDVASDDTLSTTNEQITIASYVLPTISSTLHNRNGLEINDLDSFTVSTTMGSEGGRMVKIRLILQDTSQASNITLSYLDGNGNWQPLMFTEGVTEFGPSTGFPLMSDTSDFRISFSESGTYAYTLNIVDATTEEVIASATESVTVSEPYVAPTVVSTLNNGTGVVATKNVDFNITTTAGSESNRMVQVHLALANPAQAANISAEYQDANGNWQPVTFTNGVFAYGPGTGFPLMDVTSNFRVTFNTAGTYNYSLSIISVSNGDTLATANEQITVGAYVSPTIASTLNNRTVNTNVNIDFTVTTTTGSEANRMVKARLVLNDVDQAANVMAWYKDATGTYLPLTFINGAIEFGPATGFPLTNATSDLRVKFNEAGIYGYVLQIMDASTNAIIASKNEQVIVTDVITPSISSTLNNRADIRAREEVEFTVNIRGGNATGRNVKLRLVLDNPAQATNITATYMFSAGEWKPVTFTNGSAIFGPELGFALVDGSIDFRITFSTAGTYNYNLVIADAANNTEIASADEQVTVGVAGINEASALVNSTSIYPNPAVSNLNIELSKTGNSQIMIYTVSGQMIKTLTNVNGTQTIDVSNFETGMYLVRILNNNQVATKRFEVIR